MEGHVHDAQRSGPGGVIVEKAAIEMPALKGALHTHTTRSDGELTPLEVLRVYHELGFDFIALTDHDFLMKPGAYQDVPDEFDGLLVFKGVEKTVFARGYYHVNEIAGASASHLQSSAEYGSTVDRIVDRIHELTASSRSTPSKSRRATTRRIRHRMYSLSSRLGRLAHPRRLRRAWISDVRERPRHHYPGRQERNGGCVANGPPASRHG